MEYREGASVVMFGCRVGVPGYKFPRFIHLEAIMEYLKKKKTFILSGVLILHGFISFLVGDTTLLEFINGSSEAQEMFTGGAMAAFRAAISNG